METTNVQNQTEPQHPKINMIKFISGVIVFFLIILAVFIVVNRKKPSDFGENMLTPTVPSPTYTSQEKGVLSLKLKNGQTGFGVGQVAAVVVSASSDGKSITGFDAVLSFDPSLLQYQSSFAQDSNFQVFSSIKDGKLMITGVKNLGVTDPTVLVDSPLVEVNFLTLKSGSANLGFEFTPPSKADSNLIDDKNNEVLGKVEGMTINITQ